MLKAKKLAELIEIAEQIGLKDTKGMKKQDLIDAITKNPDQEQILLYKTSTRREQKTTSKKTKKWI